MFFKNNSMIKDAVREDGKTKIRTLGEGNINIEGMLTHFATKANDIDFIKEQKNKFDKFVKSVDNSLIFH